MKSVDRLYFVHLYNDFSGSPRVLKDIIDSGIFDETEKFIFTSGHKGFLTDCSAKKINIYYTISNSKLIQLFWYLLSQIFIFCTLGYYLFKDKIDNRNSTVLINTMLPFGAGLASRIFGVKIIYYVHESYIKPPLFKNFLKKIISISAYQVIFVSNYLRVDTGLNIPNQLVIHNGLRGDFKPVDYIDMQKKFSLKNIFFCGSLKDYKGLPQLFELAKKLPMLKFNAAVNCSSNQLDKYLEDKYCPSNLFFYSRPDNLTRFYIDSFIVINLTDPEVVVETFGLSLLEGMAFGCPVICPNVGGPTEFVNANNGFLVDPKDINSIVEIVRQLGSSEDIWNQYSFQALNTAKKFTNDFFISNLKNKVDW